MGSSPVSVYQYAYTALRKPFVNYFTQPTQAFRPALDRDGIRVRQVGGAWVLVYFPLERRTNGKKSAPRKLIGEGRCRVGPPCCSLRCCSRERVAARMRKPIGAPPSSSWCRFRPVVELT